VSIGFAAAGSRARSDSDTAPSKARD
jgi:hypothetical protein